MQKYVILNFIFVLFTSFCFAQSDKDKNNAMEKAKVAIQLMDSGKIEESIILLKESEKLDPENANYPYEIAYANYLKKDYKTAIQILEKLVNYKNVSANVFSLWGNAYDNLQNPEKAIEIYDLGLKRFPDKGLLYLEKGVVFEFEKDFNKAVEIYKKGISVEPNYPSNYYRLSKLYLDSSNKVPGFIYGEIFLNLERTTDRTKEISKLLFDKYKESVTYENRQMRKLDFCELVIDVEKYDKDKKLPLCMVFGGNFIFGLSSTNELNLTTLSKVRQEFLKFYFKKDYKDYPNILFEYHKQMSDENIFDAYNHYIFQMGAPEEFTEWLKENKTEYKLFVNWYTTEENILKPTKENFFEFKY